MHSINKLWNVNNSTRVRTHERFQISGKLIQTKPKHEKASAKEEPMQEKTGAVDQIKKKYGFSSYSTPSSVRTNPANLPSFEYIIRDFIALIRI